MSTSPTIEHDEIDDLIDADTLARLRSDHRGAHYTVVEAIDGPVAVVFKRLSTEQFERAQGMLDDDRRKKQLAATVTRDVLVHPVGADFDQLVAECPAVRDTIAALALEVARGKAPAEAKKLQTSRGRPAGAKASTPAG